jgi:UDP-glucose 4-epimerase
MRKILVTGGAGYIGSHTAVELHEAGHIPVLLDNFSNSERFILDQLKHIIGYNPIAYEGDCRDGSLLDRIFKEHTIGGVIHFAAYKAVGESVEHPLMYYSNNIGSMIHMLEAMERAHVKSLVFSSSCTVYGQPNQLPVDENAPIKPAASPYGYTKQVAEQLIQDSVKSGSELQAVILRYFNPIGAHSSGLIGELPLGVPNNLVPFITQTAIGIREELTVFGKDYNTPDGTCIRDYIHVSDLARAHVQALKWMEGNGLNPGVFNVGTGSGTSVLQAIQSFERSTKVSLNYSMGERRPGDVEKVWANAEKIKRELNWQPQFSVDDAMEHAWKWENWLHKNRKKAMYSTRSV